MDWQVSWRADPFARDIADRHYTRQSIGADQFVPTGSCLVLKCLTETGRAYWVTSFPKAEWVKHEWAGAWICSAFRNEGTGIRSSKLIRQAVAATRFHYGEPPSLGMVTFVNPEKTTERRSDDHAPGWCFLRAKFKPCGHTVVNELPALQLLPANMPTAEPAIGMTHALAL